MEKMVTLRNVLDTQKKSFEGFASKGGLTQEEKDILRYAVDSINYISHFYDGSYVLPSLEESACTEWGKTHSYLAGSFENIRRAELLINGKKDSNGVGKISDEDMKKLAEYAKAEIKRERDKASEAEKRAKSAEAKSEELKTRLANLQKELEALKKAPTARTQVRAAEPVKLKKDESGDQGLLDKFKDMLK